MTDLLVPAMLVALVVLAAPRRRAEGALRARVQTMSASSAGAVPSGWRDQLRRVTARLRLPGREARAAGGDDWLAVLDQLAASLRAGLPPAEALLLAAQGARGQVGSTIEVVLDAAREGRSCGPAWGRVARSTARVELDLLAHSWGISEQLGAPLADAVDSAARSARSRRELASRLATATAGARVTVTILTLLPVAGVGIAVLMGIGPMDLYGSPAALASLVLGVVLIGVGRVVVAAMVARVGAS